jgi:hypothetical protein
VMTTESRILVTSRRSEHAAAASVSLEEVLDLRYVDIPVDSPREFADFMYFGRERNGDPVRRSEDVTFTPHDVLLSAALARGVGSSVQSFRRFYSWPGVAFVPIRDAPVEQTVLASRASDRRTVVAAFRSIATTLASTVSTVDGRFCGPVRASPGRPGPHARPDSPILNSASAVGLIDLASQGWPRMAEITAKRRRATGHCMDGI